LVAPDVHAAPDLIDDAARRRPLRTYFGNLVNTIELPSYTLYDAMIHYDFEGSFRR
jgi:hypothetical protein